MKKIIEILISAAGVGAVVIAMFLIFKNISVTDDNGMMKTGITNIVGAKSDMQLSNNEGTIDSATLSSIVQKDGPEIKYISDRPIIHKMDTVQLLDYFTVKNADDETNYLASTLDSVEVMEIIDMNGNSILSQYDPVSKNINFVNAGTYTISFKITDQENRAANAKIRIPVSI